MKNRCSVLLFAMSNAILFGCDNSDLKLPAPDPPSLQAGHRVGSTPVSPKLITTVHPRMPEAAKRLGLKGPVMLSVKIDETGSVAEVRVVQGHPALNSAAEDAVRQWKYEPVLLNGLPISVWNTVFVRFRDGVGH
jgi:TonB family protein